MVLPALPRLYFAVAAVAALVAGPIAARADDDGECRTRARAALADDRGEDERRVTRAMREAIALCERELHPDDPLLATLIEQLARVSLEAGRNDESGQLLRRALAMRERAQGPDGPDVASTASALAEVLWQRAHHTAETEILLRRALAIAAGRTDVAASAARDEARALATRRALQLTRFLLDQWRIADAAAALPETDDDATPLDSGHLHNGRAEVALARGDVCAAAASYGRAAEEYRYADFADESHSDRRWLLAWIETAPTLLVRVGQRRAAGAYLAWMMASRATLPRGQLLTGRMQFAIEALPPAPTGGAPARGC